LTYPVICAIFPSILPGERSLFLLQKSKKKALNPTLLTEVIRRTPSLREAVDPFICVADELKMVEDNLSRAIGSDECMLTQISSHLIHGGGKRIRPMVTLLVFKAFGGTRVEDAVDIATAIELIHTATLLHDDIIDAADIRRGKDSAYKKFGLKNTLVTGDFLFIKGFEFAGKFDETVVRWTAGACTRLTEGEILQGLFNRNRKVTVEDYLEIVKRKTASLFNAGAKVGAYLAGAAPHLIEVIGQYGLNLGIAFQVIDDVLDVVGSEELLGKPVGMDLRDGNPSLPIILALSEGHAAVLEAFELAQPTELKIQQAIQAMAQGAAIHQAKVFSKSYSDEAFRLLEKLPPSLYRNGLKTLVQLIAERQS
jgi:octaprenyl-diphosphate synthase